MKAILILLSLSMIWHGSFTDENGKFNFQYTVSLICAIVAWGLIVFGNVVE